MKKLLTKSLLLGLLLISCHDQTTEIKKQNLPKVAFTSIDKEAELKQALDRIGVSNTNPSGRLMSGLSEIKPDSILKVLRRDSLNYTFTVAIGGNQKLGTFKNLVFRRVSKGFFASVVEYISNQPIFDFKSFTGTVKEYNLEGTLLREFLLSKAKLDSRAGRTAACFADVDVVCVKEVFGGWDHSTGKPFNECEKWSTIITIDCTGGSGGGGGSSGGSNPLPFTYFPDFGAVGSGGSSGGGGQAGEGGSWGAGPLFEGSDPVGVLPPNNPSIDEIAAAIEDITDPEAKRVAQLNYIKRFDAQEGESFAEMVEEIIRTPGITVGDVFEINATVNRYYLNLRGRYMIAVYYDYAKAARFLIELALIETGTEALFGATKLALSTRYGVLATQAVRQTWKGFAKIFKANTDEILVAAKRIKDYRKTTGNLTGGNYGYVEGTVNNAVVDNKMWRSGAVEAQEPQIFEAIEVTGSNGGTWLRNTDSEYKMLNKLASDLGGTRGVIKPNITGEIKIISENPYCESCQGIIQQFNQMFPNIKLILIDGAK